MNKYDDQLFTDYLFNSFIKPYWYSISLYLLMHEYFAELYICYPRCLVMMRTITITKARSLRGWGIQISICFKRWLCWYVENRFQTECIQLSGVVSIITYTQAIPHLFAIRVGTTGEASNFETHIHQDPQK